MRTRLFVVSALFIFGLAACTAATTPPAPPPAAPAVVETTAPLVGSSPLVEQPLSTPIPAPTGYAQSVSASLVTVPANTTVQVVSGASPPPSIPVLETSGGRTAKTFRRFVASPYNPIYYTIVTPSSSVTVAGTVSSTQTFPAGTLISGTKYYLGFYDSTQSSPAWQTIAGPVTTPDGTTLTFSGTVPSFTFQAGATYAFCIFYTSSSTVTPPPSQAEDLAYLPAGTKGIVIVDATGKVHQTLAIDSSELALDDAGNIYNMYRPPAPSPSPSASASPTAPPPILQFYSAGSTVPTRTYQGGSAISGFVLSSGAGEFGYVSVIANPDSSAFTTNTAMWNPGAQGTPSYTVTSTQYGSPSVDIQHDGTLVTGSYNGTSYSYRYYPPGSSTPSRSVPESIVPVAEQVNFAPNYMTVGPDGTLYVTEFSYATPDTLAGLYVYPPTGPELYIRTATDPTYGAGPTGVDVDASGNIYVANNNAGVFISSCSSPSGCTFNNDTLQNIQVFTRSATALTLARTIPVTGKDPYPIIVAADGTLFFSSFDFSGLADVKDTSGIFSVAPNSSTITQVSSSATGTLALYNGYSETEAYRHRNSAGSAMAAMAYANPATFGAYLKARALNRLRGDPSPFP